VLAIAAAEGINARYGVTELTEPLEVRAPDMAATAALADQHRKCLPRNHLALSVGSGIR